MFAVAITLDFTSTWKDESGFHSGRTASVALYNAHVPIGYESHKGAEGLESYGVEGLGWLESDWIIPVVPSSPKEGKAKTGNFSLTVTVTETTETGADLVGAVTDTLRDRKSDVVNVIIKKSEENK